MVTPAPAGPELDRARMTLKTLTLDSRALTGNPLGDPATRDILILSPAGADSDGTLPVVYLLPGFGSRPEHVLGGSALGPSLPELFGSAMARGIVPRCHVAIPDCTTRYGGSQYIDTPSCGRYQSFLADEVFARVEQHLDAAARHRAVIGKSSGGYGALLLALQRPGSVDGVCAQSPDAGFEHCYLSLLPRVLDTLRRHGGLEGLLASLEPYADDPVANHGPGPAATTPRDSAFMVAMSLVAMSVCYGAEPATPVRALFPCDPDTGQFRDEVWRRWLRFDPVRLVPAHAAGLSRLGLLHLDVGTADEYAMTWGTRALHDALLRAGVAHSYAEHNGGHHGTENRFLVSLAALGAHWNR